MKLDTPDEGATSSTFVARDGEDPPHDDNGSKVGYDVVSRDGEAPGEKPLHEDDPVKTGYPVHSD